ncbi:MAG: histidine kinase [Solirubrobacterales bacterium]|nr:histidine kinase [Solirubrobacterales bacterium]
MRPPAIAATVSPPLESCAVLVDMGHRRAGGSASGARARSIVSKMATQSNLQRGSSRARGNGAAANSAARFDLRRLERVFESCDWLERRTFLRARRRARAHALEMLDRNGSDANTTQTALLVAAAEFLGDVRSELTASPQDAAHLADELEHVAGLSRIALAREVLRSPELLTLLPAVAVETQLAMLMAFAPLRSASLWALDDAEQVNCVRHVGEGAPSRSAKELAQRLLAGETAEPGRRLLLGLSLGRWQQPLAALVGCARPGMREECESFLVEAAPMLGAVLERDALLAGNAASERTLVQSSERKLTRLGFDLHDGPIQDVSVLGEDLRLFRDQLVTAVGDPKNRALLRGRLDDLDAQLGALDSELRRISNEVHAASVLLNRPFTRALRDVAHAFAARTNIEPHVTLDGEMTLISTSQQIALLNIIHEALTNVREHSDATEVEIAVSVNAEGVEAQIIDNGRGFDLEPTLIRAARRGRLGLVAMHERVRLLGGQCRIDSRRGGPTVVSVALERWEPLVQEAQSRQAS